MSSAKVEEASKGNYEELFTTIETALKDVNSAGAYDQLTLYNGVFMLLYDQRASMASVKVDKEMVQSLLTEVYNGAKGITVQKEQSKKLQQEIIDNYNEYREAIDRIYANTEERK